MRLFVSILMFFGIGSNAAAQQILKDIKPQQQPLAMLKQKGVSQKAEVRIASLLSLAALNRPKPGDTSRQLTVALSYLDQAISLSEQNRLYRQYYKANIDKLEILFNAGKIKEMGQMLLLATTDSLKAEIARNISRYYNDGHFEPGNFAKAIEYASISLDISVSMKDRNRQINANNQLGFVYIIHKKYDEAEKHFLQVINLGKQLRSDNVGYAYVYMLHLSERKGYLNRAIQYGLDALRYLERPGYDQYSMDIYHFLGRVYTALGEYDNGLEFIDRAIKEADRKSNVQSYWQYTKAKTDVFLKMGKPNEALHFVQEALIHQPPTLVPAQVYAALMRGNIYIALKEFGEAKKYLLEAEKLNRNPAINPSIYKSLADLHYAKGELDLSKEYLEKVLLNPNNWTVPNIATSYFLGFQIDSARGDFQSAMLHLQKNKLLNDSLNALSRLRQIEELKLQYQTEKIVQDVKLKQQTILLLEKQQELQSKEFEESRLKFLIENKDKENHLLSLNKEATEKDKNILLNKQSISQLQTDNANRKARLENANFIRNITLGFVFLLALVVILLYKQFKSKQAATKIIGIKNAALEDLVQEKENLLEEKDWLLKEVHHRVKNNLQTVVSLLESQSAYLQNNEAVLAIQDSQNRVHAMSLIHQKLYQNDSFASINMAVYLPELVHYLRDSFNVKNILFDLQIASIELDVSQAVPIGLILNEAITNSIKYAFTGLTTTKFITITMQELNDNVELVIADNGKGFPGNWRQNRNSGLGLKLMEGLTGDLQGKFSIDSSNGTTVSIKFTANTPLYKLDEVTLISKNQQIT